jgi:hypothetical protein
MSRIAPPVIDAIDDFIALRLALKARSASMVTPDWSARQQRAALGDTGAAREERVERVAWSCDTIPAMRPGSLLLAMAMAMIAGSARAAADCSAEAGVRSQAECVHDQMAPDVIDKLYNLALSTVNGKLDSGDVPADFLYVAEEAGEAARRKSPKPLLEMASFRDPGKLAFAARGITTFVDSVRYGWSHRGRFGGEGDAKLFADAKSILRAPCKRLAAHDNAFVSAEGKRCLSAIDPAPAPPIGGLENADFTGVRAVPVSSGRGGLRASPPRDAARSAAPAPQTSKPSRKIAPKDQGTGAR